MSGPTIKSCLILPTSKATTRTGPIIPTRATAATGAPPGAAPILPIAPTCLPGVLRPFSPVQLLPQRDRLLVAPGPSGRLGWGYSVIQMIKHRTFRTFEHSNPWLAVIPLYRLFVAVGRLIVLLTAGRWLDDQRIPAGAGDGHVIHKEIAVIHLIGHHLEGEIQGLPPIPR